MGTVKEPTPAGSDGSAGVEAGVKSAEEAERTDSTEISREKGPGSKGLPEEPPLMWRATDVETAKAGYDPRKALETLVGFHLYGRRPDRDVPEGDGRPLPALLRTYLDLSAIRYDYPLCVTDDVPDKAVRPLTEIVDELVEGIAEEGDAGERMKRHVYQVESTVKSLLEEGPSARLSRLWSKAVKTLLSSSTLGEKKKESLKKDLAEAQKALLTDGELIPCNVNAPRRLFVALMTRHWRERCAAWRDELDALISRLEDILRVDFNRSSEAKSAEHLRTSAAAESEMDYQAMSGILKHGHLGEPLPEARRGRIQSALDTLVRIKPLFGGKPVRPGPDADLIFQIDTVFSDCGAALDHFHALMRAMVNFFKAVRIAGLEIDSHYREAVHDAFFESFDVTFLTDEEFRLCPPVLVHLGTSSLEREAKGKGKLLEILSAGMPLKVLVTVEDLWGQDGPADGPGVLPGWPARLANMAMALGDVYVMQAPVSDSLLLRSGFLAGFDFPGSALFSVYTGQAEHHKGLSIYHNAAAAMESRVFPGVTYDPAKGQTLAERIDVTMNHQVESMFPSEPFSYMSAEREEVSVDLPFTPADFMLCDVRFQRHYWCVPPEYWHEDMVPLSEYFELDLKERESKVPYVVAIDGGGRVARIVMTRSISRSAHRARSFWRSVQELGGINNSFALRSIAEERQRLEEEKQREVEAMEQRYSAQLDQDIAGLTREIVQRIAAQLMSDGGGGLAAITTPAWEAAAAAPVAEPRPTTEEAVERAEEEEEESITFDDPYIDTPLCTSCNECTNINNQLFGYNENKQAFIRDPSAGPFENLVRAAELCPVKIIHPGKPKDQAEPGLEELLKRAARFN